MQSLFFLLSCCLHRNRLLSRFHVFPSTRCPSVLFLSPLFPSKLTTPVPPLLSRCFRRYAPASSVRVFVLPSKSMNRLKSMPDGRRGKPAYLAPEMFKGEVREGKRGGWGCQEFL